MRDQMIGLSYAFLITGVLLTILEALILEGDVRMRILPLTGACIVIGAAGLYWFRFRDQPGGTSGPAADDSGATPPPTSGDDA